MCNNNCNCGNGGLSNIFGGCNEWIIILIILFFFCNCGGGQMGNCGGGCGRERDCDCGCNNNNNCGC